MVRFVVCVPAALVLLAGCSPEPRRDDEAPKLMPIAASPTIQPATAEPRPMVKDSRATSRPGVLRTFGDWTVGCDNMLRCELRSLGPDNAPPSEITAAIVRDAGPTGKATLTLAGIANGQVAVDGRVASTADKTLAAMVNGHALAVRTGSRTVAMLSLKGVSAALRYTDAVQARAGTITALVARGQKPASTVPAQPSPPTIVAVAPGGTATNPTVAQLTAMRRAARCDQAIMGDRFGLPQAQALGGGRTLVLLPCSAGAYNLLSAVFVLDGTDFAPVKSDAPMGFAETGADTGVSVPTVVNARWQDGVLTSYAKGRGLGDCGVIQQFVWDGTALRLSRQRAMGECRGNADYITTWRANVVRR